MAELESGKTVLTPSDARGNTVIVMSRVGSHWSGEMRFSFLRSIFAGQKNKEYYMVVQHVSTEGKREMLACVRSSAFMIRLCKPTKKAATKATSKRKRDRRTQKLLFGLCKREAKTNRLGGGLR